MKNKTVKAPTKDVIEYLDKQFLIDLREFYQVWGSTYHDGIEDERALEAFIEWSKEKYRLTNVENIPCCGHKCCCNNK